MKLILWFFRLIFKWNGWKLDDSLLRNEQIERCVMIAAPHTSNWDLVYCLAAFDMMKLPVRFTIKKEWFRFPFNYIIEGLGGIPIDRSPKDPNQPRKSMVEAMADIFKDKEKICVLVTPEGTRKRNDKWKTGFYYVAQKANVPIVCGYLDYKKREAGIGLKIIPTGNIKAEMKLISDFYATKTPKFPEKFALDKEYSS
ncbi:MAG: 1-acyl-sn-glycerol-3-phosphate acyltransferase [Flammeovirgaceae bacterium]|nr:1-acyl-sn-glycerol-3-phosphate acyltransferase [Flammeovirgaceae bacterium]MDW8287812.1 1-acyl-sn-glycerol-3-phosphate acyltransferase [Flammeovirgaceae bacterium]